LLLIIILSILPIIIKYFKLSKVNKQQWIKKVK
jgi:uncharacterized membrane protein YwzB